MHTFSYTSNEQDLDVVRKRTTADSQRLEGVFLSGAVDAFAHDSQLHEWLRNLLNTGAVAVRIADEPIPMAATIADSAVHLFLRDDNGILQTSIDMAESEVLT